MISQDSLEHLIGIELLLILAIITPLLSHEPSKRGLSRLFLLVLGLMLAHAVSHVLPQQFARFIYSTPHPFHSLKAEGVSRS